MGDRASGRIYEEKGFLASNFEECGQKNHLACGWNYHGPF